MNKIQLRSGQNAAFNNLKLAVKNGNNKVLFVLPTGGGKSVIIGHLANSLIGRTLVLTHRVEILNQNSKWIKNLGILTSNECTVDHSSKVVIAMVQTLHARIKKHGENYIGKFDNIILDEAHIQIFDKITEIYNYKRLFGFTATPVIYNRIKLWIDGEEYNKQLSLADFYDTMIIGQTVKELIFDGFLVEDRNFSLVLDNIGELKDSNSNPDGYTSKSLTNVYSNKASLDILLKGYNDICKNKKTLIFNATTKVNKIVYELFKSKGINVKNYDSVNSKPNEREEVINWFRNTDDAVLIGTNVFTTGFDVDDVINIIINRKTKSLSLWIQMVGRGSRPSAKIFKNHFNVLDLGQNIEMHGIWSDDIDWWKFFEIKEPELAKKKDLLMIWECSFCGAYNVVGNLKCSDCGKDKKVFVSKEKPDKTGQIIELNKAVFPRGQHIVNYCRLNNKDKNFAFKLLDIKILDLFKNNNISKNYYIEKRDAFVERIREIYRPAYFSILRSDLKNTSNNKLLSRTEKCIRIIDEYYGM